MEYLQTHEQNKILTVTIDRPPVNALNTALVSEIQQLAKSVTESENLRVVILTATGKVFCAGADLKERKSMSEEEVLEYVLRIKSCFRDWYNIPIPVICGMNGGAYGGGLELALMADMRILASNAKIGLTETRLGIIPGAGGIQRLSRLSGEATALRWILPGKVFSADDALQDNVVDHVVSGDNVLNIAQKLAGEILEAAPVAVKQAKRAVRDGLSLNYKDALDFEIECYKATIPTEDRKEALQAFAEKRKPNWTGS